MIGAAFLPERLRRFIAARLDRSSELGLRLTINVALFAAAVWAFSGVLEEVLDNEALVRWDLAVASWFHDHASTAGTRAFVIITQFGAPVIYVIVTIVAVVLWRRGERLMLWTWLAANTGGKLLELVLKMTVHRTRPEHAAAYLNYESFSFPSGHTMGATICYFMLAFLMTGIGDWQRPRRLLAYGVAAAIVAAVAFSRIYLGVHYPSDILGGFAAGAAWITLCLITLRIVRWDTRSRAPLPATEKLGARG